MPLVQGEVALHPSGLWPIGKRVPRASASENFRLPLGIWRRRDPTLGAATRKQNLPGGVTPVLETQILVGPF